MKKIVIAPDSYKGSLSAKQVCEVIASAAQEHFPEAEIVQLPVADGGEGLVDALLDTIGGEKIYAEVSDPLGRPVRAFYGVLPDKRVVIEMAAASGLPLVEGPEKDVLKATTLGTGALIGHALVQGYREFILGLGGSATNDGGAGAAAALGIRYLDADGAPILAGGDLSNLARIDTDSMLPQLKEAHFLIACDVNNPLYGPNGAAFVYSPQKGANPGQVALLDAGLRRLAEVVQNQTGLDLQQVPGTGAAGGLVVPFITFADAAIKSGLEVVLDGIRFDDHLEGCDLVVTGEGRTDSQSSMGKVLSGVGMRCKAKGVPVVALSGALESGAENLYDFGIDALFSTTRKICSLEEALAHANQNLKNAAGDVFRLLKRMGI